MNNLWDEISQPDLSRVEEAQKKAYEENIHFLTTFSTPSGKIVLEWLTKHTLDTPTWWPDADYNKTVANGFFREGQNCLVRQLKSKINQAKEYKGTEHDGRKRKSGR